MNYYLLGQQYPLVHSSYIGKRDKTMLVNPRNHQCNLIHMGGNHYSRRIIIHSFSLYSKDIIEGVGINLLAVIAEFPGYPLGYGLLITRHPGDSNKLS